VVGWDRLGSVSPLSASQHSALWLGQFGLQSIPFGTKAVDLVQHPLQQKLSRSGGYSRSLEQQHLLPLPPDLKEALGSDVRFLANPVKDPCTVSSG
jgi:hypothetical protein